MRSFILACSAAALFAGAATAQDSGLGYSSKFLTDVAPIQTIGTDATAHLGLGPRPAAASGLASITDRYLSGTVSNYYASFYDGSQAGPSQEFHEFENHLMGSLAIGGYINQATSGVAKTRIEAEVTYREAEVIQNVAGDALDATNEQIGIYGNGYMDFFSPYAFAPYLGAGLGVVSNDISGTHGATSIDGDSLSFGYQAMAGITAPIAQMAVAKIGYRFQGFEGGDVKYGTMDTALDLEAGHSVDFGMMIKF